MLLRDEITNMLAVTGWRGKSLTKKETLDKFKSFLRPSAGTYVTHQMGIVSTSNTSLFHTFYYAFIHFS